MSLHITILDRLRDVAKQLEAIESYAVRWEDERWNWSDPIHVMRGERLKHPPRSTMITFQELAQTMKPGGSAIEMSPSKHCLLVPVPVKGKHVALSCIVVRADDRLAFFMLKLAKLLLQREDYFSDGANSLTGNE